MIFIWRARQGLTSILRISIHNGKIRAHIVQKNYLENYLENYLIFFDNFENLFI